MMKRTQRKQAGARHRYRGGRLSSVAGSFCLSLGFAATVTAESEIAQVPLIVTADVAPNVVFIQDDSAPMQWETMPDEITLDQFGDDLKNHAVMYMFPFAGGVYGGDDYWQSGDHVGEDTHHVPTFREDDPWAAFFRSPHNNELYYDPDVTYEPWVDHTGQPMDPADPEAAPLNPVDEDADTIDLTQAYYYSGHDCWIDADIEPGGTRAEGQDLCEEDDPSWWELWDRYEPATYFEFDGDSDDDLYDPDNYTRKVIEDEDELQNFANWFTYHRSRILASRAAAGRAFAGQDDDLRVAQGAVHAESREIDGGAFQRTVIRGVRPLGEGTNREDFYDFLYGRELHLNEESPLRESLMEAGEYYERDDDEGPWSDTPGQSGGDQLACRPSYSMLMTDGYWDGDEVDVGNVDGEEGEHIAHPDPEQGGFRYEPEAPYADRWNNTLADVAMHFWKRDLRDDLDNRVPVTPDNEAFWQHMSTFAIGLGRGGTLDPDEDLPALTDGDLDWPDPTVAEERMSDDNRGARVDDLWHATLNSRGRFFQADRTDDLADAASDALSELVERTEGSAASVAANSTRLDTGTRVYQAQFNSSNWGGHLVALDVRQDGSVDDDEVWDAAEEIPAPEQRNIVTWDEDAEDGTPFQWDPDGDGITEEQMEYLEAGTDPATGEQRLEWLRGDPDNERREGGPLRNRPLLGGGQAINPMGDIVNSDPFIVGQDNFGFTLLPDADEAEAYEKFRFSDEYQERPEVLYVGSNAGKLHAIDAEDGEELFAYVPDAVFPHLHELTDPNYTHRFFVDGSPRAMDAYIDGDWATVLVGSTGAGGRSVFALDVTDPENFDADDVLWEFTHEDLGATIGQPTLARLESGDWVAIFANGYESDNHTAQLFVVDLESGEKLARLDTGEGSEDEPNGLGEPLPVDTDGFQTTEYVYAGDLHGNMWKFDLTGNRDHHWEIAFNGDPLFTTPEGRDQPITARPEATPHEEERGRMVFFGTGQLFQEGDNRVGDGPPVQRLYGLHDDDTDPIPAGELQAQEIEREFTGDGGADFREMSDEDLDDSHRGWVLPLVYPEDGEGDGERVVEPTVMREDRVIFTTTITSPDPCDFGGSGWLMEVDPMTGQGLQQPVFDVTGDGIGEGSEDDGVHASGRRFDDVITAPTVLDTGGPTEFKYMSSASGDVEVVEESASRVDQHGRINWQQLR